MYDDWDLMLINAIRNETCPICKLKGKDEFDVGGLKFCSDEHLKYFQYLLLRRLERW